MRTFLRQVVRVLSSFGLSCTLLVLLGLLTWLGTLEQTSTGLFEVQKKYFESFVLVHRAGPVPIPLPGANLVMSMLFVNLLVGGIVRLRRSPRTAGVLVAHLGIALLLAGGFVQWSSADEGHVTLYEGQRASHFQSYYRWEIAISEPLGDGRVREHLAPQELFEDALGARAVTLVSRELPFALEVRHFARNCRPLPKGPPERSIQGTATPVVGGLFLQAEAPLAEAEANIAGLYVTVVDERGGKREDGILWGAQARPMAVSVAGRDWAIDLRKERYPMSFALALEEFTKEDHPRLDMPRSFSSDVTVHEGASARAVKISMNEPLRHAGLVLYQASWGPSTARPGEPLFSTFAVVRNPADRIPLVACVVIAAGLIFHFSRKLAGYVRAEARRA